MIIMNHMLKFFVVAVERQPRVCTTLHMRRSHSRVSCPASFSVLMLNVGKIGERARASRMIGCVRSCSASMQVQDTVSRTDLLPRGPDAETIMYVTIRVAMKNLRRFWRNALQRVSYRSGTCINRPLH